MNITGQFRSIDNGYDIFVGAFTYSGRTAIPYADNTINGAWIDRDINFDASRSWTGEKRED